MRDEKILNLPWDLLSFFLNRAWVSPFSGSYSFSAEIYHLIDELILSCTVQKSLGGSGSCKCSKVRVSSWHNFLQLGVSCSIIKMLRSLDADLLLWAHGEYIAGWIIELIMCGKLTQRVVQETANWPSVARHTSRISKPEMHTYKRNDLWGA